MDIEKKQFEGNDIRTARVNGKTVYALADALAALAGQENGKKYWTKRKQRARTAGEDIAESLTRVRMPGVDGKLRLTDAVTADALARVADELPAERLEAFTQWHASLDKPTRKPRGRRKTETPLVTEAVPEIEADATPVAKVQEEAAAESAPVPARRKRSRGGRKKSQSAQIMEEVLGEVLAAEAEGTAEPAAVSVETEGTENTEAAPVPTRRKRSRGGRKKSSQAVAEEVVVADVVEEPGAEEPVLEMNAEAAEIAAAPARRKRSRGGKKKSSQAAILTSAEPEEDKTKEKVQKAVTKAVAKAAAKAAVKAVEKVAEHPMREQADNGEMIRRAIGRRESMAVLIDADNAQLTKLKATMDELSKFGRIVVRKAYGDWKNPCLKNWESVLTDLAIKPEQQFAYTKGKNATDIALVIDAMDLLATGRYDTFAIICSDSDYTPLVMRLRETGAYVFGIGADKTPSAFVNACDVFINTRMFAEKKPSTPPTAALPDVIHPLTVIGLEDVFALMKTATEIHSDSDGWTSVSDAGSYIKKVFPSFRVKSYGYSKMADLVLLHPERFETKTYAHRGATILAYRLIDEE